VARRNAAFVRRSLLAATGKLIFSIITEHLGFCVWLLWSIAVLSQRRPGHDGRLLPDGGLGVAAVAAAVDARNWTVFLASVTGRPTG
jgi:hypothetical protein